MAFKDDLAQWTPTPVAPPDMGPTNPMLQGPGAYPGKPGTPTTPSILSTSYKSIPVSGNEGEPWEQPSVFDYGQDPYSYTGIGPLPDTAVSRVVQAAGQAAADTRLLTPEARAVLDKSWIGRNFGNPAANIASLPFQAAGAVGGALVHGAYELGNAIDPALGRALATLAIVGPGAETPGSVPRILPRDMGLPYGFRDTSAHPLPPDAFPRPGPAVTDKIPDRLPPGAERIPPELPTSLPKQLTSADIKTVTDARYGNVTRSPDVTSADAVDRAVDLALPSSVADEYRRQFGKDSIVGKWIDNLQELKGKDLPVQGWKGTDQSLSDDAYASSTTPAQREQLLAIQRNLRGSLEKPLPSDLTAGDGSGYTNLQAARQAASQQAKMQALEEIARKSAFRINEPQSVRSQIATFLSNPDNIHGWSQDEIAAATKAQSSSQLYDLIHTWGSRIGAGAAAGGAAYHSLSTGDPLSMLWSIPSAAGLGWTAGEIPRMFENMMVRRRLKDALDVLGRNVPVEPVNPNLVPPMPRPSAVPDTRALTYPTLFPGAPRQQD